ncbi:MAG: TonB-dependent receptor [Gammaproteobacteria bacterium]|nr:TonB-dependent receptor [Gammaproteobacteria bacterium]MBU2675936.1 TonB-dependent receptor [Gammaproteobacteria bacterium]NNC56715.1 TonB-dependent receptor [Woeseiaceae bacterium]NNL49672.1 TonB-dependent receptor [Woeseiaceae bacterium]
MRLDQVRALLARTTGLFVIVFFGVSLSVAPVYAQDAAGSSDSIVSDEDDDDLEEVIVTGSRLKRDTYTSIAPLQIITGQVSREVGLMDAGDILQESTAASGTQVDLTFQGVVLDNGPGATNINLRGLGGARTLVLINGRRVAPAGVEGAPTSPDLGLVPSSLVQQYDLLLDGASSVYGSDAVAGVANIIMRKDFDGFEIEAFHEVPQYRGGEQNTLSLTWGKNFDRGFIGVGAEYTEQERVALGQRPWTGKCNRHAEIDEDGNVRSQSVWQEVLRRMPWDDCAGGPDMFTIWDIPDSGRQFWFYTPGTTNTGVPNWSDWSEFGITDVNNDGLADVNFRDYSSTDKFQDRDLFSERTTTAAMAFGEYTFEGEANITPFFEVQYGRRKFNSVSGTFGFFPAVPANNPYNPCNPNGIRGVDCSLAQNELYANPNFLDDFVLASQPFDPAFGDTYGDVCAFFGITPCSPITVFGPNTPAGALGSIQHILYPRGHLGNSTVDIDQTRGVLGVRGDLPGLSFGSFDNWSFELAATHSSSSGDSSTRGIREDRIDYALGWYSFTNTPCENDSGVALSSDVTSGCVPVDLFAPSLLEPYVSTGSVDGEFATQAERDYLFDGRDFVTKYKQTVFTAYASGDIFELPGGTVAFGIGLETRKDDLESLPNNVAAEGLLFGRNSDQGAIGDKTVDEFFAEVELPIFAGVTAFEELTVNLSTRYTDDEYYGGAWTGSYKLGWRPVDSLLIRGTFGTSFRAPNLRELFLAAQTGFNNTFFDPCYVPLSALDDNDEYDPELDQRDPVLLANCLANGVDPTLANLGGQTTYPVEIQVGGALDLFPEKSESWTAGLVWDLPFNAFDLTIGSSYYEIDIRNSIIEPDENFIVGDCYNSATGESAFCSRITRDLSDLTDPRITLIDAGFINRDNETARGVDLNLAFTDTWTFFDRPVDVTLDMRANRQLERSTLFVNEEGVADFNEFQGSFGFPNWKGRSIIRFDYADWRLTWETNYTGSVEQRPEFIDEFEDAITGGSDTCFGPPDDVLCRDIGFAENYFRHAVSVYYYGDEWALGAGVRNVLAEDPPFVDGTEVRALNNSPIGYGYDLMGRTFFMNASYNFGGGE